ncbi:Zinc phosphodiesterase ELAC protein 1 [Balamuthia mandrillaris]
MWRQQRCCWGLGRWWGFGFGKEPLPTTMTLSGCRSMARKSRFSLSYRACSSGSSPHATCKMVDTEHASLEDFSGMGVLFLGTSSSIPTVERGVSSTVLRTDHGCFMVDCGDGTQRGLTRSHAVSPAMLKRIFITHRHGDHLLGLPALILSACSQSAWENKGPLHIYAPSGVRHFLRTTFHTINPILSRQFLVHELYTGTRKDKIPRATTTRNQGEEDFYPDNNYVWHLYQDQHISIKAGYLIHKVPCWGYVFEEAPIRGTINVEKCRALGLEPGPDYQRLKAGLSVTSPTGHLIHSHQVLSPTIKGRKVVIMGDTCDASQMADLAHAADLLVHECTLPSRMAQEAPKRGHSCPSMVGRFAEQIKAKALALTHFSARLKEEAGAACQSEDHITELALDVQQYYTGQVLVARDLAMAMIERHYGRKAAAAAAAAAGSSALT